MEKKNPTVIVLNPATGETQTLTHLSYEEVWDTLEEMEGNRAAQEVLANEKSGYKAGQRELDELNAALEPFPMVREVMDSTVGVTRLAALAMKEAETTSAKLDHFNGEPFTIAKQVKALNGIIEDPFQSAVAFALLNENVIRIRKTNPDEFEDIPLNSAEKLITSL